MIFASKFKGSDVFGDPAFAHSVDFTIAEYTSTTRCFPDVKTSVWRKLPANGRSYIFNMDECHDSFILKLSVTKGFCVARMRLHSQRIQ